MHICQLQNVDDKDQISTLIDITSLSSAVTVIIIITVIITWIHLTTFPRVTIAAGSWRGRINFSIKCVSWVNSLAIAYTLCYLLEKFPRLVGSPSAFVVVLPTSLYLASNLSHFRMHCYLDTTTSAASLNGRLQFFRIPLFCWSWFFRIGACIHHTFSINKRTKRSSHFYSVALALPSADDAEACCSRSSTVPIELKTGFVSYWFTQIAWNCYFVHVKELCALRVKLCLRLTNGKRGISWIFVAVMSEKQFHIVWKKHAEHLR